MLRDATSPQWMDGWWLAVDAFPDGMPRDSCWMARIAIMRGVRNGPVLLYSVPAFFCVPGGGSRLVPHLSLVPQT